MSHFSVLVFGEDIDEQLRNFSENTKDVDKKFIEFNVCNREVEKDWEKNEKSVIDHTKTPKAQDVSYLKSDELDKFQNGEEISCPLGYYNRLNVGDSIRVKKDYMEGGNTWEEFYAKVIKSENNLITFKKIEPEMITIQEHYKTIENYAKEVYGYTKNSKGKFGYYTNKQAKWDGYIIGGRWGNFLTLKDGKKGVTCKTSYNSMDYLDTTETADQARKGDIDWKKIRLNKFEKASTWWEEYEKALAEKGTVSAGDKYFVYGVQDGDTKESFIKRQSQISTFAVLKDGKFYKRGKMGWWGCVSDEKDEDKWNEEWNNLVDSVSDDTLLTVVDCHI